MKKTTIIILTIALIVVASIGLLYGSSKPKSIVTIGNDELLVLNTEVNLNQETRSVVVHYDVIASNNDRQRSAAYAVHTKVDDEWKTMEYGVAAPGDRKSNEQQYTYGDLGPGIHKIEFFTKFDRTSIDNYVNQYCYNGENKKSKNTNSELASWQRSIYGNKNMAVDEKAYHISCSVYGPRYLENTALDVADIYTKYSPSPDPAILAKTHRQLMDEKITSVNHNYEVKFVNVPNTPGEPSTDATTAWLKFISWFKALANW